MATRIASTSASGPRLGRGPRTSVPSASAWSRDSASPAEVQVARLFSATVLGTGVDGHDNTLRRHPRKSVRTYPRRPSLVPSLTSFRAGGRALATETLYLPGTEVELRGLRWEVINATPMGDQTLVRLRGTGGRFRRQRGGRPDAVPGCPARRPPDRPQAPHPPGSRLSSRPRDLLATPRLRIRLIDRQAL